MSGYSNSGFQEDVLLAIREFAETVRQTMKVEIVSSQTICVNNIDKWISAFSADLNTVDTKDQFLHATSFSLVESILERHIKSLEELNDILYCRIDENSSSSFAQSCLGCDLVKFSKGRYTRPRHVGSFTSEQKEVSFFAFGTFSKLLVSIPHDPVVIMPGHDPVDEKCVRSALDTVHRKTLAATIKNAPTLSPQQLKRLVLGQLMGRSQTMFDKPDIIAFKKLTTTKEMVDFLSRSIDSGFELVDDEDEEPHNAAAGGGETGASGFESTVPFSHVLDGRVFFETTLTADSNPPTACVVQQMVSFALSGISYLAREKKNRDHVRPLVDMMLVYWSVVAEKKSVSTPFELLSFKERMAARTTTVNPLDVLDMVKAQLDKLKQLCSVDVGVKEVNLMHEQASSIGRKKNTSKLLLQRSEKADINFDGGIVELRKRISTQSFFHYDGTLITDDKVDEMVRETISFITTVSLPMTSDKVDTFFSIIPVFRLFGICRSKIHHNKFHQSARDEASSCAFWSY